MREAINAAATASVMRDQKAMNALAAVMSTGEKAMAKVVLVEWNEVVEV